MRARRPGAVLVALVLALATMACSSPSPTTEPTAANGDPGAQARTWRVPEDQPTIAAAVAVAHAGDLVLISPGRYQESVHVTRPGITVRGLKRNDVVLDGENKLDVGISLEAGNVAIENLSVRGYVGDAIRVGTAAPTGDAATGLPPTTAPATTVPPTSAAPPSEAAASAAPASAPSTTAPPATSPPEVDVRGYRVAYVTVANSGGAGVRVAGARGGVIDHVLASDLNGAGLAVSGCLACDLVVTESSMQMSRVGLTLDRAAGVVVATSTVRRNRIGLRLGATSGAVATTPTSSIATSSTGVPGATVAPGDGGDAAVTLVGLTVADNDGADAGSPADQPSGDGVVVLGPDVAVLRNRVTGHQHAGIWLTGDAASSPLRVQVRGNVLTANTVDVLVGSVGATLAATGSCFADNQAATASPATVLAALACGAEAPAEPWPALATGAPTLPVRDYRLLPLPAPQPSMPGDPAAQPAIIVTHPTIDVASIAVPGS